MKEWAEVLKKFEKMGIDPCIHDLPCDSCSICKQEKLKKIKPKWREFEFQVKKKFEKIYKCELNEVRLYPYKFECVNLEKRILLDAKTNTSPENPKFDSNQHSIDKMMIIEKLRKEIFKKVLVFLDEDYAIQFVDDRISGKLEHLVEPGTLEIWHYDGFDSCKQIFPKKSRKS
tara:strand:+ start:206 stop:724 length:519 start_codon:yes stop_codon:yes gene_type:complete